MRITGLNAAVLRRGIISVFASIAISAVVLFSTTAWTQDQSTPSKAPDPTPTVIKQYCLGCHNDRLKQGGLSLSAALTKSPASNPELWEKVFRKLQHRHMPPPGLPRPAEHTYEVVLRTIAKSLDEDYAKAPKPGRTSTFRRLNRLEYRNAVRDLLDLEVDVSALLPADETSHGFDNITVGDLSPTLLERYLLASQKISRTALGTPTRSPGGDTILIPPDLTQEDHFDGLPFGTRGGTVVPYNFPANASYDIQLRLARDRNERVEGLDGPHQLELSIDGVRTALFTAKPPPRGQSHDGVDTEFNKRVTLTAGRHEIGVTFVRKTSALIETERQPTLAHFNMDRHPRIQPALYSVSIVGPYDITGSGESSSRRKVLSCYPTKPADEEPCAREITLRLARRAWRRAVSGADVDTLLKIYRNARQSSTFENGIEMLLRAILVSPEFVFRIERDPAESASGRPYRISDVELASRLSFFLWSSIPDEELLDLALHEKLRDPAVLERQVRRMLADSKSETLVTSFASQWLYLRNLATATPDPRLFPDFDENLRQAFRRETELFFDSIKREDRSVLDLLRADYTFLNERLAKHYGIPDVYGSRFRKVKLPPDSMRGGILSHGSILTVTSYANRTSPVVRGKWILANILGTPPAPPPPEVPQLKEAVVSGKTLSMRERLAQHRANTACASCHNLMDPIGFALENYDATGRWRTIDSGIPVDPSGIMPDGTRFAGPAEMQRALLRQPQLFAGTIAEKLLTFALGRGVESYDQPAIRQIVREAAGRNYRFSDLILNVVKSPPFQMRSPR